MADQIASPRNEEAVVLDNAITTDHGLPAPVATPGPGMEMDIAAGDDAEMPEAPQIALKDENTPKLASETLPQPKLITVGEDVVQEEKEASSLKAVETVQTDAPESSELSMRKLSLGDNLMMPPSLPLNDVDITSADSLSNSILPHIIPVNDTTSLPDNNILSSLNGLQQPLFEIPAGDIPDGLGPPLFPSSPALRAADVLTQGIHHDVALTSQLNLFPHDTNDNITDLSLKLETDLPPDTDLMSLIPQTDHPFPMHDNMFGLSDSMQDYDPSWSYRDLTPNGFYAPSFEKPRVEAYAKLQFDYGWDYYLTTFFLIVGRAETSPEEEEKFKKYHQMMYQRLHGTEGVIANIQNQPQPQPSFSAGLASYDSPHLKSNKRKSRKSGKSGKSGTSKKSSLSLAHHPTTPGNETVLAEREECVVLGIRHPDGKPVKNISRQHARIFYDFDTRSFNIEVLGKNGIFVDDKHYKTGCAVPLTNGSNVSLGRVSFRFLLPDTDDEDENDMGIDMGVGPQATTLGDDDESHQMSVTFEDENGNEISFSEDVEDGESGDEEEGSLMMPDFKTPALPVPSQQPQPQRQHSTISNAGDASDPDDHSGSEMGASMSPNGTMQTKRGRGRPPKNGIMSVREIKILKKEKEAVVSAGGVYTGPEIPIPVKTPKAAPKAALAITAPPQSSVVPTFVPPAVRGPSGTTSTIAKTEGSKTTAKTTPKPKKSSSIVNEEKAKRDAEKAKEKEDRRLAKEAQEAEREQKRREKEEEKARVQAEKEEKRQQAQLAREAKALEAQQAKEQKIPKPPKEKKSKKEKLELNLKEEDFSPEDLLKPTIPYSVMIFDAISESTTGSLSLPHLYHAIEKRYPYFAIRCATQGWQSSVRHNLRGCPKIFYNKEKEGKGYLWAIKPGANVDKERKKRRGANSPPPPSQAQIAGNQLPPAGFNNVMYHPNGMWSQQHPGMQQIQYNMQQQPGQQSPAGMGMPSMPYPGTVPPQGYAMPPNTQMPNGQHGFATTTPGYVPTSAPILPPGLAPAPALVKPPTVSQPQVAPMQRLSVPNAMPAVPKQTMTMGGASRPQNSGPAPAPLNGTAPAQNRQAAAPIPSLLSSAAPKSVTPGQKVFAAPIPSLVPKQPTINGTGPPKPSMPISTLNPAQKRPAPPSSEPPRPAPPPPGVAATVIIPKPNGMSESIIKNLQNLRNSWAGYVKSVGPRHSTVEKVQVLQKAIDLCLATETTDEKALKLMSTSHMFLAAIHSKIKTPTPAPAGATKTPTPRGPTPTAAVQPDTMKPPTPVPVARTPTPGTPAAVSRAPTPSSGVMAPIPSLTAAVASAPKPTAVQAPIPSLTTKTAVKAPIPSLAASPATKPPSPTPPASKAPTPTSAPLVKTEVHPSAQATSKPSLSNTSPTKPGASPQPPQQQQKVSGQATMAMLQRLLAKKKAEEAAGITNSGASSPTAGGGVKRSAEESFASPPAAKRVAQAADGNN